MSVVSVFFGHACNHFCNEDGCTDVMLSDTISDAFEIVRETANVIPFELLSA